MHIKIKLKFSRSRQLILISKFTGPITFRSYVSSIFLSKFNYNMWSYGTMMWKQLKGWLDCLIGLLTELFDLHFVIFKNASSHNMTSLIDLLMREMMPSVTLMIIGWLTFWWFLIYSSVCLGFDGQKVHYSLSLCLSRCLRLFQILLTSLKWFVTSNWVVCSWVNLDVSIERFYDVILSD